MLNNTMKIELTATRLLDDDTPYSLTASIGVPVEANDEAIIDALNNDELMVFAVGALYDLVAFMRPQWLDGENTGMVVGVYFGGAECRNSSGFVRMDKKGYSFDLDN